jgi:thiol-disulfide isomerase/thioredoxin
MKKTFAFAAVLMLLLSVASYAAASVAPGAFDALVTTDIYGQAFDASLFSQRLSMVNIWATWCGPCVGEIPGLGVVAKEYAGRLNMIGVLLDGVGGDGTTPDQEALQTARDLFEQNGVEYPCILPTKAFNSIMDASGGVSAIPTTWFVDTDGNIIYQTVGSRSEDDWRALIEEMLGKTGGERKTGLDASQYRTLMVGMSGEDVSALKKRLTDLGYYKIPRSSGLYTDATADVIAVFQERNGLHATGIATPETQALLFSDRAVPMN